MPRSANPYYASPYPVDPAFEQIGSGLGQALFGNPELAQKQALAKAEMAQRQAAAEASHAAAGYDTARTGGQNIENTANTGLPALMASMYAAPSVPQPGELGAQPAAPAPHPIDTMRAGLPALLSAMVQGGHGKEADQIVNTLAAFGGDDEMARRGIAARGNTPGKEFALTPERADDIAAQGYNADYRKDTAVATINNRDDVPVANIQRGSARDVALINNRDDIPVANIQGQTDREVARIKTGGGFDVVSSVLPGAVETSGERSVEHNREVGGAENSFHLPGDGVNTHDIKPMPGMTFAQAKARMQARYGSRLVEALDETVNTKGTGPHWHFAVREDGKTGKADKPVQMSKADIDLLDAELVKQINVAVGDTKLSPRTINILRNRAVTLFQRTGNPTGAVKSAIAEATRSGQQNMAAGKPKAAQPKTAASGPPPGSPPGTRQAPDGNWYVKRGNQFFKVG